MPFSWFQYISTYQELSVTRVICILWKKGNSSEQKGKGLSTHGPSLLLWQLCAGADLPCLSSDHNITPGAWVLPALLSQRTKQLGFNKLNFTPDRQDVCGKVGIIFKIFTDINFHLRALVRGEEQGRGNSRSATCRTNPGFPSSSRPGHFTPAGLGAQFAPVSEGAGEPCSCRVT